MGFGGLVQTVDGRNELAKAELGERFQFTAVSLGDGQYQGALASKGSLVNEVMRLPISKMRRDGAEVILECDFSSKSAPKAFYFREVGIIANGKLCFYDNAGADAEYIDPDSSAIVKQKRLRFVLAISSSIELSVTLDEGLYALEGDLKAHIEDGEAHVTPEKRNEWDAKQDAMEVDSALSSTSTNPIQNKAVKAALDGKSSTGHTHPAASTTASGFMSSTDKRKLNGVEEGANNYTHPPTHPASMVSQDATHRFVTDAEKRAWDGTYEQSTGYTDQKIADLIGGDPETLGTLKDFAEAVKENGDLIKGLDDAIGKKADKAELDTHVGNSAIHVTATDKANWDTDIAERAVGFTQATSRVNIASGEKLKAALGKIRKWFADLEEVAFTGSYDDLLDRPAVPKAVRVKGEKEESYRTGDVNLAAGDIGLERYHTYSLTSTSANMDADLKAFFSTLPDECFTIYLAAGATYRVDGYKMGRYGVLRKGIYVSAKKAVQEQVCACLDGVWGSWHTVYTDAYKPTPAGIGAVPSEYLEGHFIADDVSKKFVDFPAAAGWYKIAVLNNADATGQPCMVTIKRFFAHNPGETHKISFINSTNKYVFSAVYDTSYAASVHLVKKIRFVKGAGGKCYLEVYYSGTYQNDCEVTIENALTIGNGVRRVWEATGLEKDTEAPAAGSVAAVYDIPEKFNMDMLARNDYLESLFVAGHASQKTFMIEGVGWKKIAEVGEGDVSTGSCIIDIKRQYGNMNNEYHRLMFLNTYKKYEFCPVADKTNIQTVLKARVVTGAAGKCFIEIYYNLALKNPVTVTIENANVPFQLSTDSHWEAIDPINDTETPAEGTVAATYEIPTFFNTGMLAMKDGSNVDGVWGDLAAGEVYGRYTQNSGLQAPGYVPTNRVRFNMMRQFKGLTDIAGTYMDCMLMNCYDGNDVPYVTALGIRKGDGNPRAFIAVGQKNNNDAWESQAELITTANYKDYLGSGGSIPGASNAQIKKVLFSGALKSGMQDFWTSESSGDDPESYEPVPNGRKYVIARIIGGIYADVSNIFVSEVALVRSTAYNSNSCDYVQMSINVYPVFNGEKMTANGYIGLAYAPNECSAGANGKITVDMSKASNLTLLRLELLY